MTVWEREEAKAANGILRDAGYTVSEVCCSRPSCFDFAARKSNNILFVKFQPDLGTLSARDSHELKGIAIFTSATSLMVGEKMREKPLEDDTVYSRYNILAVTPTTFRNFVTHKIYPLIQAAPGGYYVEIDGEAIKKRRQALGLSVGGMAKMVGLSRRTLYGYERGMAKASVTAAYNMIYTLGIPVAKPVNIFDAPRIQRRWFLVRAKHILTRSKFLQMVIRRLARFNVTAVRKAPFDFVILVPEDNMRIIGGVADEDEVGLNRRVAEILSVSRVVKAHPVLIAENHKTLNEDISCLCTEELARIKTPEDLIR